MKLWNGSAESFLKKHGWKKVRGYKVDVDSLGDYDDKDYIFFEKMDEFAERCTYWAPPDDVEVASDDPDHILDQCYTEYFDDNGFMYDEPVEEKKP